MDLGLQNHEQNNLFFFFLYKDHKLHHGTYEQYKDQHKALGRSILSL